MDKYLVQNRKDGGAEALSSFPAEAVEQMKAACEEMDYLKVEDILHKLDEQRYDDALESKLQTLLSCCAGFEYDRLEELIRGL